MNAEATPNATHIPCRCIAMWRAWSPARGKGSWRANRNADEPSDSSTRAQVDGAGNVMAAIAMGTRYRKLNGLSGPPVK